VVNTRSVRGMTGDERPGLPDQAGPGSTVALLSEPFTEASVTALRHALAAAVAAAGLSGRRGEDFVLAAHELVTNAVRHGGGAGRLELRLLADVITCEIIDYGQNADALPMRPPQPHQIGGRGLWLAHHLTGALMLTRRPDGVTATVSVCVTDEVAQAHPTIENHGDTGAGSPMSL
jgi:serine/threonine-protein kinase RsbW